jgi:hypothetical protein
MDLNFTPSGFNASVADSVYWHHSDVVIALLVLLVVGVWFNVVLTFHLWMQGGKE